MHEPGQLPDVEQRRNAYVCDDCHGVVTTVDRHEGVTPMFLACRALGAPNAPGNPCKGTSVSSMYELGMLRLRLAELDVPEGELPTEWAQPSWEWYAASVTAIKRMMRDDPGSAEYCHKGGLLLRRIEPDEETDLLPEAALGDPPGTPDTMPPEAVEGS